MIVSLIAGCYKYWIISYFDQMWSKMHVLPVTKVSINIPILPATFLTLIIMVFQKKTYHSKFSNRGATPYRGAPPFWCFWPYLSQKLSDTRLLFRPPVVPLILIWMRTGTRTPICTNLTKPPTSYGLTMGGGGLIIRIVRPNLNWKHPAW